ncbi:MAG: hypothetical protein CO175_05435 [Verrucomicrobia bacterium CG_4_9_14_3_um_filter_43_20]|nr:MAG: hypothetical protein CO175_05435 [Verrucomicrobia bacterium CG_4_9_14_3_um_filter_43_20]
MIFYALLRYFLDNWKIRLLYRFYFWDTGLVYRFQSGGSACVEKNEKLIRLMRIYRGLLL